MKKILIYAVTILVVIGIVYQLFKPVSKPVDTAFKHTLDSLHHENDSLKLYIAGQDERTHNYQLVEAKLLAKVSKHKQKVKIIYKYVKISKKAIDRLSDPGIVHFYNNRYPHDTLTNPIPIARPVLNLAAKDLLELDGDRQILQLKDSIIVLDEVRLANKDCVITNYISKEDKYKTLITNKDVEISGWINQYGQLQKQDKKFRLRSKFQKIVCYLIIGGLTYAVLHK